MTCGFFRNTHKMLLTESPTACTEATQVLDAVASTDSGVRRQKPRTPFAFHTSEEFRNKIRRQVLRRGPCIVVWVLRPAPHPDALNRMFRPEGPPTQLPQTSKDPRLPAEQAHRTLRHLATPKRFRIPRDMRLPLHPKAPRRRVKTEVPARLHRPEPKRGKTSTPEDAKEPTIRF